MAHIEPLQCSMRCECNSESELKLLSRSGARVTRLLVSHTANEIRLRIDYFMKEFCKDPHTFHAT